MECAVDRVDLISVLQFWMVYPFCCFDAVDEMLFNSSLRSASCTALVTPDTDIQGYGLLI